MVSDPTIEYVANRLMINRFLTTTLFTAVFIVAAPSLANAQSVSKASVSTPMPKAAVPKVHAKRVIVVDNVTGKILYEKNSMEHCAVASTQKLLTALCVMEAGSLENSVRVQTTDTKVEPTKIYIRSGETYKRRELLKALVVKSGNDAARALARDVAGSQVKFRAVMNARAKKLGMQSSHFVNPHGLTESGQYSTARDIAILMRKIVRIPTLRTYMAISGYYFQPPRRKKHWLTNTNKLLKKVKYCMGGKTGYTHAAGRCLVSYGELRGRSVIVVCLGSTPAKIWADSASLMKWSLEQPAR
ncbi:MAG: D-alanyl-D-alanine carboxypeptidase (penicillin-binding protein 5/6) [Rubritalea sp.]|jgi:D-alanyl-D-alanine carboxypeptidase (penicillin-binding protein 5/6)